MSLTGVSPDSEPRRQAKTVRHLTPDEVERAAVVYASGQKITEVAAQFGVSKNTMSARLKASGVQLRYAALTNQQIQTAVELYDQGWSFARIGEHLGKEKSGIWRAFKEAGIARRDTHGRERPD